MVSGKRRVMSTKATTDPGWAVTRSGKVVPGDYAEKWARTITRGLILGFLVWLYFHLGGFPGVMHLIRWLGSPVR